MTHGRHCSCSACAREDWTQPHLAPCGMHGPDCPPVYAPDFVPLTEAALLRKKRQTTTADYESLVDTALDLYAKLREAERENERLREELAQANAQLDMEFSTTGRGEEMNRWYLIAAVLTVAAVALLASSPRAVAHPKPKPWSADIPHLHIICKALGKCKDPVPRVGPKQACTPANDGAVEIVWDNRLEVYVTWECRCGPDPGCHWYRQDITHSVGLPWAPPHKRVVLDAMRACKSIVCEKVWVPHFYPTQWIFGR